MKNLIEMFTGKNASQQQTDLVKELLAKDLASENSYLLRRMGEIVGQQVELKAEAKTEAKTEVKSKKETSELKFGRWALDADELKVGKSEIKKAAKELLKNEDRKLSSAWGIFIDVIEYSPCELYRKAFELAGYDVNWKVDTYRALSWFEHHGFEIVRK